MNSCKIIGLPKITGLRGNLKFIEACDHLPLEIKRVYYLYDVPGGAERAGHALKACGSFLIAISGIKIKVAEAAIALSGKRIKISAKSMQKPIRCSNRLRRQTLASRKRVASLVLKVYKMIPAPPATA